MRIIVKKETTGRIGWRDHYRRVEECLHRFVEEHRKHGKSGCAGEFVRV